MLTAPIPANEDARLRLLRSLAVLDTPPEESFDRITRLVAQVLHVPIALVSLVDDQRQWFKSRVGLNACETSRDVSFCAHALGGTQLLQVEDALDDLRFNDNPLVLGDPHIRFYAGVPLRSSEGLVLGTLCALDTQPRALTSAEESALTDLARMAERELIQREAARDTQQVQEHSHRALVLSEARFSTIFQQTPTGTAIVDLQGRFVEVNPMLCEIVGYSAQALQSTTFQALTHPDDLAPDLALVAELLGGARDSYSLEKRYIHRNGALLWVSISVSLVRDHQSEPLHYILVVQDINARKQSEAMLNDYQAELERRVQQRTADLERSRETLQTITDNMPILIAQVDRDLCYRFNNEVYRQIFGVDPASLRGQPLARVLRPELYAELLPYFRQALSGERVSLDNVCYSLEQERVWSASYIPEVLNGEVIGFYIMSQDITERKRAERLMHDQAMLDPLTNLPNRRALQGRLDQALAPAHGARAPFAIFFMDLDGFKAVNDKHGHEAGDELLKQVAQRLRDTVRRDDFVCRLAGDEFVVLANGVPDSSICSRIAESICQALHTPFCLSEGSVTIGTSAGIVLCPADSPAGPEALLASADAAMYQAKRRGRNGYSFADLAV
ncbi:diguanylate cyclase domain-containing protein [Pseudomonas sp. nanlin1]|uniref:bifunctional diguanylate cyclase/phosphodiesterase n=1 Tax=Pseudomonas sp. nanlin1 TaxID=3040605 RepID=UPI00388E22F8